MAGLGTFDDPRLPDVHSEAITFTAAAVSRTELVFALVLSGLFSPEADSQRGGH
jgi:hypothetical protein